MPIGERKVSRWGQTTFLEPSRLQGLTGSKEEEKWMYVCFFYTV